MRNKKKFSLDAKIEKDIIEYCNLNCLNYNDYLNDLIRKSFLRDKYGDRPDIFQKPLPHIKQEDDIKPIPKETPQPIPNKEIKQDNKEEIIVKRNKRKLV